MGLLSSLTRPLRRVSGRGAVCRVAALSFRTLADWPEPFAWQGGEARCKYVCLHGVGLPGGCCSCCCWHPDAVQRPHQMVWRRQSINRAPATPWPAMTRTTMLAASGQTRRPLRMPGPPQPAPGRGQCRDGLRLDCLRADSAQVVWRERRSPGPGGVPLRWSHVRGGDKGPVSLSGGPGRSGRPRCQAERCSRLVVHRTYPHLQEGPGGQAAGPFARNSTIPSGTPPGTPAAAPGSQAPRRHPRSDARRSPQSASPRCSKR